MLVLSLQIFSALFIDRFHRANQAFIFPIHLSHDIVPNAVFYGTILPVLAFWVVKVTVMNPYLERQKEQ